MNLELEHIARKHKEWVRVSIYLGSSPEDAEDYVQNMYIKLAEIQMRDGNLNRMRNHSGGINTVYIFKILTNIIIDSKRKRDIDTIPLGLDISIAEIPNEEEGCYSDLMACIKTEIESMHPYEQMLLELHFVYGMSMRQIEAETNIPTHSIFNTLKNAKSKIKQKASTRFALYIEERGNREKTDYGAGGRNPESDQSDWD
jgi:RNA polymerase sigma factor (sigma-70 family)